MLFLLCNLFPWPPRTPGDGCARFGDAACHIPIFTPQTSKPLRTATYFCHLFWWSKSKNGVPRELWKTTDFEFLDFHPMIRVPSFDRPISMENLIRWWREGAVDRELWGSTSIQVTRTLLLREAFICADCIFVVCCLVSRNISILSQNIGWCELFHTCRFVSDDL